MADDRTFSRRQFLWILACGGGLAATVILQNGCATVPRYQAALTDDIIRLSLGEFTATAAGSNAVLVEAVELRDPIVLVQIEEDVFRALSARCTHQGCQVRPGRSAIRCPCHGSMFDFEGRVLRGPAQKPLPTFRVGIENGIIEITVRA